MHRWTSILGALLLVLMLWTGGAARAAEPGGCIPVTASCASYGDDQGKPQSGPCKCAAHCTCVGHYLAASVSEQPVKPAIVQETASSTLREAAVPDHSPDSDLRPPIA